MGRFSWILSAFVAASVAQQVPAEPVRYLVTDLGTFGGRYSSANGINSKGEVVGNASKLGGANSAYVYKDGKLTDLGTATGGSSSSAYAVNESGSIVLNATFYAPEENTRAYIFANGELQELGTLGGGMSSAVGIADDGSVVGASEIEGDSTFHAFLWRGGSIKDLGTLGGGSSAAYGINASGQIVGRSHLTDEPAAPSHAFLYENGQMKDLGTLGGPASSAYGINDAGVIVGASGYPGGVANEEHAFVFKNGEMSDLGTVGGKYSGATAINSSEQIVGYSETAAGLYTGFLYENGVMHDLNDLIPKNSGWKLAIARGINDQGEIIGNGVSAESGSRAYLLRPVQPPSVVISGKKTIRTKTRFVTVRGMTRGDVTSVRYHVYRGKSGTARGISKWNFRVPVKHRKNTIEVIAMGYNQKKAKAKITVFYPASSS